MELFVFVVVVALVWWYFYTNTGPSKTQIVHDELVRLHSQLEEAINKGASSEVIFAILQQIQSVTKYLKQLPVDDYAD